MKLFYGWVIVAVGIVVTCVGFGAMLTLSIFLQPMAEAMGWSRTASRRPRCSTSSAWGWARSCGARCPTALARAPSFSAAAPSSVWAWCWPARPPLSYSSSSCSAPSLAWPRAASTHPDLDDHPLVHGDRSLAVALVSAGLSVGSTVMAPLARWLITSFDWRIAMWVIGDLVWLVVIPAALLVRNPPTAAGAPGGLPPPRPAPSSRSGRSCARRSSRSSRSRTSRAARRTGGRSSTWSPTPSTAACPRWPPPRC